MAVDQRQDAVCVDVVIALGDVLLELSAREHVRERELVVDPEALPVIERPDSAIVVIREVIVVVVLGQLQSDGGLAVEPVGMRPLEQVGVDELRLGVALARLLRYWFAIFFAKPALRRASIVLSIIWFLSIADRRLWHR